MQKVLNEVLVNPHAMAECMILHVSTDVGRRDSRQPLHVDARVSTVLLAAVKERHVGAGM